MLVRPGDRVESGQTLALIEGLRSTDPHVRAVIADDPPEDARVVPELVRLLSDPRSFVRTRASVFDAVVRMHQAPEELEAAGFIGGPITRHCVIAG